ncbi:MAG: hypothetical protein Q8N39_09820 [Pelolinea sp.]|nr:hypothetical protein [Pelolinea sp.]
MPISGVGAACDLGAHDANNDRLKKMMMTFFIQNDHLSQDFEIIKTIYT